MDPVATIFRDQSTQSSVPNDVDERKADRVVEGYKAKNQAHCTRDVLSSFLRFLPADGRAFFAEFIVKISNDYETLYGLYIWAES